MLGKVSVGSHLLLTARRSLQPCNTAKAQHLPCLSLSAGSVVPYSYNGEEYFAVPPEPVCGKPSLWALVSFHGQDLFCRACSRPRGCEHVLAVRESGQRGLSAERASGPWLGAEKFEERLEEALDLETGDFKLYCLSRARLPTHLGNESELQQLLAGVLPSAALLPATCLSFLPMPTAFKTL